ncbi:hypothetical protein QYM36_000784, partial [Artemia franciscana]
AEDKKAAFEETKNYATQSLASVAYQINTLAYNFLNMLDEQSARMNEMESQINHINQMVMIHKEKVARREIGVLTANKTSIRQYKILAPAQLERPIKYVRRPVDFSQLDDVGHGVRVVEDIPLQMQRQRLSSQSSLNMSIGGPSPVPPAPTSKPPTPPQGRVPVGTLSRSGRSDYRTPPAVAPPTVPTNYAPNYPIGHPRRTSQQSSQYGSVAYGTLPHSSSNGTQPILQVPQVGMVHPIQLDDSRASSDTSSVSREVYARGSQVSRQQSTISTSSLPPPPPGGLGTLAVDGYGQRPGDSSPPLPPPPSEEGVSQYSASRGSIQPQFSRETPIYGRRVLPAEENLPGWVPKNYIEKVVAVYDYVADKEDELSFQENSVIYVLKKNDDGWWEGVMDGITGLFPGNYVEPCM